MMQLIRGKAHGVISWIIVGVIALAFCLSGVGYLATRSNSSVAEVNGQHITAQEVDDLYNRVIRHSAADKNFDITKIDPKLIKQQLAKSLAEQKAIITGLQKDRFAISDDLVVENIRQDPNLQEDGKFSIERYKMFLAQINLDEATFERLKRDELLFTQAQQGVIASSFVTKGEINSIIAIRNQQRDFGYTIIPRSRFQTTTTVSEEQITDYYKQHATEFIQPQQVKLEYLELSIDNLMPKVQVSEQQLREYYKNNIQQFTEPEVFHFRHIMIDAPQGSSKDTSGTAKAKIDAIYTQLQQGADFSSLAKTESEDPTSASRGGDLGWASKNDELPAEVYALTTDGAYTAPVQTQFGWHIFFLQERKTSKPQDFAAVRKNVEARYKREEVERLFAAAGEELANLTFENPKTLQPASEKLNLPIKSTDYFSRQEGEGIAKSKSVLTAAFSEPVLAQQQNSDLIRISDDSYVVIRVADNKAQRQLDLAEVKAKIIEKLQAEGATLKAQAVGEELLAALKQGVTANKAADKLKLKWQTENNVGLDSRHLQRGLLQQVFLLPKPEVGSSLPVIGFKLANGDYVVAELRAVRNGTIESSDSASMEEMISAQMALLKGRVEFESFQAALVDKAKIKYGA